MRVYAEARSPLLKEIFAKFESGNFLPIARTGRRGEVLCIPWFPECKHGVLVHEAEVDDWGQCAPSEEEENIIIAICESGSVEIRPGDDDGAYLRTSINSSAELLELMDFFTQANADCLRPTKVSEIPLSVILDKCGLFVREEKPRHGKFLEFKADYFDSMPEKLAGFLDAYFTQGTKAFESGVSYWDLKEFLKSENIELPQEAMVSLEAGDLLLDSTLGWKTAGEFFQEIDGGFGYAPCLVVRLKDTFSKMYFSDFARLTTEGSKMTALLMAGWKSLRKTSKETGVVAPKNKIDQVARSVSLRVSRMDYIDTVQKLSEVNEPLQAIASTYRKRSRAAKLLHNDFLEDTVAMESPLPFFIEFPYRRFRKQDDELEKVKAGQRLLTILSKVPLFLLIEELRATKQSLGDELMTKVGERPASDGVLVDLQKSAVDAIQSAGIKLSVFAQLTELVANNTLLEQMVTARNRWHHEPFDHENFLRAMTEYSARYIPLLRQTLADISFMVPHRMEFVDGQKIVVGDDICSPDAHFRKTQWQVDLPVESFPTNVLVAYRASCKTAVPLGNLITSKFVDRKMLDFGVFDRQSKSGEPVFVFLRSLNEG